jgi:hypothetical protein
MFSLTFDIIYRKINLRKQYLDQDLRGLRKQAMLTSGVRENLRMSLLAKCEKKH